MRLGHEKDTAKEDDMEEAEEEGSETKEEDVDEVVEPPHNEPATLNVEAFASCQH